jgi:hypothetical protein
VSREVSVVLTDGRQLPPFRVDLPWWQEVAGIVAGAKQHHGLDLSVLRILRTEPGLANGGEVSYLCEELGSGEAATADDHPLRTDYAKPGGPARTLAWAASVLGPIEQAEQLRTWNLSAIWRLRTAQGTVWLKQVPHFFAHEPNVLRYLGKPHLLGAGPEGRMLMANIPGTDLYGAEFGTLLAITGDIVKIQLEAARDIARIRALGVPPMIPLPPAFSSAGGWAATQLARAAACGLPDTLVHGDLHPGNVCGTPEDRTIIDWGDSFIGHPAFDILRLTERLSPPDAAAVIAYWAQLWRDAIPGCEPAQAAELLRPVAALRMAAVYQMFLDNIEPTEHPYHVQDVPSYLDKAQRMAPGA